MRKFDHTFPLHKGLIRRMCETEPEKFEMIDRLMFLEIKGDPNIYPAYPMKIYIGFDQNEYCSVAFVNSTIMDTYFHEQTLSDTPLSMRLYKKTWRMWALRPSEECMQNMSWKDIQKEGDDAECPGG